VIPIRLSVALLTACLSGLSVVPAQSEAAADASATALEAKLAKAIADYEALATEPQKPAQRRRALLWLGEIDLPKTTDYLQNELLKVGDKPFAAVVIEAIGKVARPSLRPELWMLARRVAAPPPVRTAAAKVVLGFGDAAIDEVVRSAGDEKLEAAVRESLLGALAESGDVRALRGLVPLLSKGEVAMRVRVLRRMDMVRGVALISDARIKWLREAELEFAAVAWRQLVLEEHPRARALTVDVIERFVEEPKPPVAADLIIALARVRDADFYPLLLRYGSGGTSVVRDALRQSASAAAEDPALIEFLVKKGLDDARPGVREAAKLLLLEAPVEAVRPLVERLRADLRAGRKKAMEQAASLHELLVKDPTWRADLAALAQASDLESRLLGLSMLLELGADAGVETAQQSLGHKSWELRSLAYRYLTRCRDATSIPLLIARYEREEGRLAAELDQALFVHTGTRCWKRVEWERWWGKHKVGFALPHPDSVQGGGSSSGGKTISYHDIPVVSSRMCFLVDRSGSMSAPIGTDKKFNRLAAAKQQLTRVVEALPATTWVNLIDYETGVHPLWEEVRKLDVEARKDLLDRVSQLQLAGGTNIFEALEVAFKDGKVDTVYLLTDGQPSSGRLTDPEDIIDEVRRWNRTKQVVIHCIGLGIDSDLLKRLAAMTGGSYKYVR
jgi:von Willebrand factor type A domain